MPLNDNTFGSFKPRGYKTPLSDPEADSVIKKLGSASTSALQTGLYALDTPGAYVRGGLGKLTGAKASDGDRVSGRDLTNSIGLTSKYDRGWGAWGAGLGAEMLTDPLSYFTGGAKNALTGAGKAASKLGATKGFSRLQMLRGFDATESGLRAAGRADDIAHFRNQGKLVASPEIEQAVLKQTGQALKPNQPLGALGGFGLPFRDPSFLVGTGPRAQKIAGTLDSVGDKLKYGTIPGRWATALLDSRANGSVGGAVQKAAIEAGDPAYQAAQREGRSHLSDVIGTLDKGIKSGIPEEDLLRGTRDAIEGVGRDNPTLLSPSAVSAGTAIRNMERSQILREHAMGQPLANAGDQFTSYGPRQGIDLQAAQDIAAGRVPTTRSLTNPQVSTFNNLPIVAGDNFHRDEVWRGLPGGTNQVNDFVKQYAGSNLPGRQIERDLQRKMISTAQSNGWPIDRPIIRSLRTKSEELADRIPSLSEDHAKHGIGLFTNNEAANAARSAESFAQKQRSAATIYGVLGNESRARHTLPSDAIPISKVLEDLGLNYNRLGDAATFTNAEGSHVKAYEALARQGAGKVDPYLTARGGQLSKALDRFALPRSVYNDLVASHGRWSQPEVLKGPMGAFKDLTTTFKNLVYPLFPASNVRNLGSGLLNNVATGTKLRDHMQALGVLKDTAKADELRRVLPEIPVGASDAEARDIARRSGFVDAKIFNGHAGNADLDNNIANRLSGGVGGRVTPDAFGADRTGGGNFLQDTGKLIGGGLLDQAKATGGMFQSPFKAGGGFQSPVKNPFRGEGPLAMEGVWGHNNSDFPALQAGRKVGSNIEDFLRMAKYLGERRKGFAGSVAGDAVRNLHFDYDALTGFEKNVARQAFPFYTFMRKNLPLQAGYLASKPFAPVAQMRVMEGLRDQSGGYTPGYLASGAAIPISGGTGNNQRYISGFGTPLEEALERVRFKNGLPDVAGTLQQYLASGNPFIKAPLEQVFDKQLSTGRNLSDLRAQGVASKVGSLWGDDNPQLFSQILANSPAARFASSFDKLTDDRKPLWARALNLGTGVKLTDVDLERQKAIEAAATRNKLLSSMPHIAQYTHYYPKQGEVGNLTPEEVELLRLIPVMRDRAMDANKESDKRRIGIQSR